MTHQNIINKLWDIYTAQNPSIQKVYDLFVSHGETVFNDHIAFRTFDDPRVNIDALARVFVESGYREKGTYRFEKKKLTAKHFEHMSDENAPRVFISQLITSGFSSFLMETVMGLVNRIPPVILGSDELIYSGNLWGPPEFDIYERLKEESEYAAWLYVYGFCANHFTVSVNHLKNFPGIRDVNTLLKNNGFLINDSGGEVKGTPEQFLEQSSIRAEPVWVRFSEGGHEIPGCYYEFAKRYKDSSGVLFSGFIADSADKIFESTDFYRK
jgi:hypothetical protein